VESITVWSAEETDGPDANALILGFAAAAAAVVVVVVVVVFVVVLIVSTTLHSLLCTKAMIIPSLICLIAFC